MSAKFLNESLLQSKPFRENSGRDANQVERPADNDHGSQATERQQLESVLDREHNIVRSKAEEKSVAEIGRRRTEVADKLEEFTTELKQRHEALEKELAFCGELRNELQQQSQEVTPENLSEMRRLVRQIDLELLKRQRQAYPSRESRPPDTSLPSMSGLNFVALTRIGLGLTWPLIVTLLLAALGLGIVLFSLFNV